MNKIIRKILNRLAPITVCADWIDSVILHKCWSRAEALEWTACYPVDAVVLIRNRAGEVISWRG